MDAPAGPGSEHPATRSGAIPGMALNGLPRDLQSAILSRVSETSGGFSHALVSREWAALAPEAQRSCTCACTGPEGSRDDVIELSFGEGRGRTVVRQSQLAQELSQYPGLTSLDIACPELAESFLSVLPVSLRHLWWRGGRAWMAVPPRSERATEEQTSILHWILRFPALQTLCLRSHAIRDDVWPLSASLRVLDIGGLRKAKACRSCKWAKASRRSHGDCTFAPDAFLESLVDLRELRVLRATVSNHVLPESMARLTKLREINLYAPDLEGLFSGIGVCQNLRRLLIQNGKALTLPPSITQLPHLDFLYLSSSKSVTVPQEWASLTSLKALHLEIFLPEPTDREDALLSLPSVQWLQTSVCGDMSKLTSLQELVIFNMYVPQNPHESMWALASLRVLSLEGLYTLENLPESIRGLSNLEELGIIGCWMLRALPRALGSLPKLQKLSLETLPRICSLREAREKSITSWPSLQTLRLKDLRSLQVQEVRCELREWPGSLECIDCGPQ